MPGFRTDRTYGIITGWQSQSNDVCRAEHANIPNQADYAQYSGLALTYQMNGGNANSVKTFYRSGIVEATLENYGRDTAVTSDLAFYGKSGRSTDQFSMLLSCAKRIRFELNQVSNTNDLIIYQNSLGDMSAIARNDEYDLTEHFELTMESLKRDVFSKYDNFVPIFHMNHGEINGNDYAAAGVAYQQVIDSFEEHLGFKPLIIITAPDWDRPNTIQVLNDIIQNNANVFSAYGSSMDDLIDETVLRHNNTGVPPTVDKTQSLDYTFDGTHFRWFVPLQYGIMAAEAIKQNITY